MPALQTCEAYCPYCGEPIELLIDDSEADQDYIEDCQVCCQPICISAQVDDEGSVHLLLRTDSE